MQPLCTWTLSQALYLPNEPKRSGRNQCTQPQSLYDQCTTDELFAGHVTDLLVLASNATQDCQGEGDQRPDDKDDTDGAKWQRCRGVVRYGYCIEEREADEHWPTEQGHCEQHVPHLQISHITLAALPTRLNSALQLLLLHRWRPKHNLTETKHDLACAEQQPTL